MCLLADIRLDIDELLIRLSKGPPLLVVSADHDGTFADERPGPLELMRNSRPIRVTSRPVGEIAAAITPHSSTERS